MPQREEYNGEYGMNQTPPGSPPASRGSCHPSRCLHDHYSLAVNIDENGDADVTVDYSLSWMERFRGLYPIAHPEQQPKQRSNHFQERKSGSIP